ncbi:MAG: site-specific integrase, partial [bacterium]
MEDHLREFLNYLRIEKNAAANTVASYQNDLLRYINFLQQKGIHGFSQVMPADILALIHVLNDIGLTVASTARNLSAIRMFHRFLLAENYSPNNPTANISFPKQPKSLPKVLSPIEVEKILAQPETNQPKGLRDRAMLEFLYGAGLRVSELISIPMSNLFFDDGFVRIMGKGSKERIVPIGEQAIY